MLEQTGLLPTASCSEKQHFVPFPHDGDSLAFGAVTHLIVLPHRCCVINPTEQTHAQGEAAFLNLQRHPAVHFYGMVICYT